MPGSMCWDSMLTTAAMPVRLKPGSVHHLPSWSGLPKFVGNRMRFRRPAWWTGVLLRGIGERRPAYVLVWRNALQTLKPGHFYAPYPGQVSEADFGRFYDLPRTLFAADMTETTHK